MIEGLRLKRMLKKEREILNFQDLVIGKEIVKGRKRTEEEVTHQVHQVEEVVVHHDMGEQEE
jgi:hypothetical protein